MAHLVKTVKQGLEVFQDPKGTLEPEVHLGLQGLKEQLVLQVLRDHRDSQERKASLGHQVLQGPLDLQPLYLNKMV